MKIKHKTITTVIAISILCLLLTACDFFQFKTTLPEEPSSQNQSQQNNNNKIPYDPVKKTAQNIELGMPDYKGSTEQTEDENWIISRPAYTLSYNHERNIPNWVCWHIDSTDLGHLSRPDYAFNNDPKIKPGHEPVMYYDYQHSTYGFDRGHMCPNGDRTRNERDQLDTFYMTNMVPQAKKNNEKAWAKLESYIRSTYVKHNMEVYVVSGPSLENGGYSYAYGEISKITNYHNGSKEISIDVPAYTWKVIIAIPNGDNDIERINRNPSIAEVYAVWMDNSDKACDGRHFNDFLVSIDFVEEMTGFDFFPLLDDAVEAQLESINSEYDPITEYTVIPTFYYEKQELNDVA